MNVRRDDDREKRVLERVPAEYIREGGTDYCPETELSQRPRSVFTRTAAAEVITGEKDFGVFAARSIEEEIGFFVALFVITPIAEQVTIETFLGGGFEEARGD